MIPKTAQRRSVSSPLTSTGQLLMFQKYQSDGQNTGTLVDFLVLLAIYMSSISHLLIYLAFFIWNIVNNI